MFAAGVFICHKFVKICSVKKQYLAYVVVGLVFHSYMMEVHAIGNGPYSNWRPPRVKIVRNETSKRADDVYAYNFSSKYQSKYQKASTKADTTQGTTIGNSHPSTTAAKIYPLVATAKFNRRMIVLLSAVNDTSINQSENIKPHTYAGPTQGIKLKNKSSSSPMTDAKNAKSQPPSGSIAIRSNDASINQTENIKPHTYAGPTQGIDLKNITSSPPMTDAKRQSDSILHQNERQLLPQIQLGTALDQKTHIPAVVPPRIALSQTLHLKQQQTQVTVSTSQGNITSATAQLFTTTVLQLRFPVKTATCISNSCGSILSCIIDVHKIQKSGRIFVGTRTFSFHWHLDSWCTF
ncbi:hypothetical protein OS493_032816 [Desmophyllum pertusum]|uniref:Uncharacterized protein n=1 Tax=Desmophyllum pertusum TaxID=174260 RepID=A0A9W9Z7W2_9CNID|nr:hypothetical protein OS493_032816 [Desmophyllum pertusum]